MAWRQPTESDLVATLSAREVEAYRRSAEFASDPVSALLLRTGEMARGYLRQSGVAMSPVAASIPEGLVSAVCDYAAFDILKRLPTAVGEDRRRARDEAVKLFEAVAKGAVKVETYGETDDTGGSVSPTFTVKDKLLE